MENFEFLTTISGIYKIAAGPKGRNFISQLEVYFNKIDKIIKIKYTEISYNLLANNHESLVSTKKGEFILNLGYMLNSYIIENISEKRIKELIFASFNDHRGLYFKFEKIF